MIVHINNQRIMYILTTYTYRFSLFPHIIADITIINTTVAVSWKWNRKSDFQMNTPMFIVLSNFHLSLCICYLFCATIITKNFNISSYWGEKKVKPVYSKLVWTVNKCLCETLLWDKNVQKVLFLRMNYSEGWICWYALVLKAGNT